MEEPVLYDPNAPEQRAAFAEIQTLEAEFARFTDAEVERFHYHLWLLCMVLGWTGEFTKVPATFALGAMRTTLRELGRLDEPT